MRKGLKKFAPLFLALLIALPSISKANTIINYDEKDRRASVDVNKVWKLKFNRELDSSTVNSTNVYVEDESNNRISTSVSLSSDKKTILITPYSNYVQGKKYHIILKGDVKSKDGRKFRKPVKVNFTVNNLYAGLPYENGLIILRDTAYSIDYLAKNSKLRNEIINDNYDVYYIYSATEQKIKSIFGNINLDGTSNITKYNEMNYIGPDGEKSTYKWNSTISEYELVVPSVEAEITVNSTAKVIMVKVNNVIGVDGAAYFKLDHINDIKTIGQSVVYTSTAGYENISILNENKDIIAKGKLITQYSNSFKTQVNIIGDKSKGNTAGNTNNNGYIAEDSDDSLFYNNTDDKNSLYRLDTSGMFNNAISTDNSQYINAVNGWIYYSNYSDKGKLYKIKIDGTGKQKLTDDMAAYVTVSGDWIYYSNHSSAGKLYKIRTNGTGRAQVSTALNSEVSYINVLGDWIYYTDKSDKHRPYVINVDGTYKAKLSDEWADSIQVQGDWIYYTSGTGILSKVKKDGTGSIIPIVGQTREVDKGFHLNVLGNWIYYSNYLDGGKLYKIRTDGSGVKMKLGDEVVDYINLGKNYIYYTSKGKLYRLPIDSNGKIKGEAIKKSSLNNKIIQIDDLRITVPHYDVNLTLAEIEKKYIPEKVPGIKDDNTMHQFSVAWDKKDVDIKNGLRIYTGDVIGFNTKIALELEIPSEMLNDTNTITVYNNTDKASDIIEVKNLFDNNPLSNPPKLNAGETVSVYDSEDRVKLLGKATVVRNGRENKAVITKLDLDTSGQQSVWITVTRQGKSESRPTEVNQADMPVVTVTRDNDDVGFGIDGRDFTIEEWFPTLKARLNAYYVYALQTKKKLDLSNNSTTKALKGYGDVLAGEAYSIDTNLSNLVSSSNKGLDWTGDRGIAKDSSGTAYKAGKYDIFIAGRYNTTATADNVGRRPTVIAYISSLPVTLDIIDNQLPKQPTLTKTRFKGNETMALPVTLGTEETAWLVPVSTLKGISKWKTEDGFNVSQFDQSNANNSNGLRPTFLEYDVSNKTIIIPGGMQGNAVTYADLEYKLVLVNKVGASIASVNPIIVDNRSPELSLEETYRVVYLGNKIVARSNEDGKIYLIRKSDSINSVQQLEDAVKAGKAKVADVKKGVGYDINTTGLEADVNIDLDLDNIENYKLVAVDLVGNISAVETLVIWSDTTQLDQLITEASEASLSDALDADKKNELVTAMLVAKGVSDKAIRFKNVTQQEINIAFDVLKFKMINLGIASKFGSIDEILRAEQNNLQDITIDSNTVTPNAILPSTSRFIDNELPNIDVFISWTVEGSNSRVQVVYEDGMLKVTQPPTAKDEQVALKATITVTKDGVTKPTTKRVIATIKRKTFTAINVIDSNSDNTQDGIRKGITITWNEINTTIPHTFKIVASSNGTPAFKDEVASVLSYNAAAKTWSATFDYPTTTSGRTLYVAVVVEDSSGNKALNDNVLTVTLAGETVIP